MAHYAFIDSNTGIVVKVIVGVDETETQIDNGIEVGGSTEAWEAFYQSQTWHEGLICKRTSYNAAVNGYRKQYAGIGFTYDSVRDEFVASQPFASWTLDENNDWQPPTPMPSTGGPYRWSEEDLEWVAI